MAQSCPLSLGGRGLVVSKFVPMFVSLFLFCFFAFRTIKKLIFPRPLKGQHPGSPPVLSLVVGLFSVQLGEEMSDGRGLAKRSKALPGEVARSC